MEYLRILLAGALTAGVSLSAFGGCTAPDPGLITFAERPSTGGEPSTSGAGGGGGGGGGGSDGGGGGGGADAAKPDPIFGTAAFQWTDPGVAANTAGGANHPGGKVEGVDCVVGGCHGAGTAKPWLIGGTVYTSAQGGTTVPKAEILVIDKDGKQVAHTFTDANGNFWIEAAGKTLPAGSKVGVRKEGGAVRHMVAPLQPDQGGCQKTGCHNGPPQGRVYVP